MNFLYFFIYNLCLHTQYEFAVQLFLLVFHRLWDIEFAEVLSRIGWMIQFVHFLYDMVTNVEQVASALVSAAPIGFRHYLLLVDLQGAVVIKHPPLFGHPVEHIWIVMAISSKAVVHYNCM